MTNPFKQIAYVLGTRGALFSALGLILLARAVPTLMSMEGIPDIPAAIIGALLLTAGIVDLIHAAQRMTRLRTDKLEFSSIDYLYAGRSGGGRLPPRLMAADENPNEAGQANMIEWMARVFPKLAYMPRPYTASLHAVMIALSLGVLGIVILVVLRVLLAGSTDAPQLTQILDWYLWLYFVLGFAFWAALNRFGFRRALHFEGNLRGGRMVAIFLVLLAASVFIIAGLDATDTNALVPPDLGGLTAILILGSIVVIGATFAITFVRSRRAPDQYSVFRGEEFFTVGMHPTDMINVIKSFTGKLGAGGYMHMGSWKPEFAEHTAVSAGEFEANLNAESAIVVNDNMPARPEKRIGTGLAMMGLLLIISAGFLLFRAAAADWSSATTIVAALRYPTALLIFGALFYRLGLIPIAELEWTSILTNCHLSGTFQTQGGMALMSAGDNSIKGSVLTSATVQTRCAYLTSVGFIRPGVAKHAVPRLIDQVQPADQVSNELLAAIHSQANQMMSVGTQLPPMKIALPDKSDDIAGQDDIVMDERPPAD